LTGLKVLSKDEIQKIDAASLEVLERVGLKIWSDEGLTILRNNGAVVDLSSRLVKIPSSLVDESIKSAPKKIVLYGRGSKYQVELDGSEEKRTYVGMGARGIHLIDLNTGKRRAPTLKDLEDCTRVADALQNIHVVLPFVNPMDVPQPAIDRWSFKAMVENTEKPIMTDAFTGQQGVEDQAKMAAIVVGSEDELRKKPLFTIIMNVTSPLEFRKEACGVLMTMVKHGLPVSIESAAQAGGTAPVTLARTLVQTNAEFLCGLVLAQLVKKGAPVIYGICSTIMDMRTGSICMGAPEMGLICAAGVQIAHHYGLPDESTGGNTDSVVIDARTGSEKTVTGLPPFLARSNLIHMMAGQLEAFITSSPEQLVIDNEILGSELRVAQGIDVNDETLAVKEIAQVGPGGVYLGHKHTLSHFTAEHWVPTIYERIKWETWKRKGSKTIQEVAKNRTKQIMSTHYPEPVSKDVRQELEKVARSDKTTKHG